MGKKRIYNKVGQRVDKNLKSRSLSRTPRKKVGNASLYVQSTFNNTMVTLTDKQGNTIVTSSAGALGFKGAKKGTPYAAAEVGKLIGEKSAMMGVKEVDVTVKGAGSGRDAAIRSFSAQGIDIVRIQDKTPVPHNGVRPRKARRV